MLLSALALCLLADPKAHRDIAYVEPKNTKQTLDLYAPASAGTGRPILVWVHGGGWQAGDKAEVHLKPLALADRGCQPGDPATVELFGFLDRVTK